MYAEKFDKDLLDPFKTEEPEKRKDYPDDTRGEDHPLLARLWCEDVRKLEGDIKALASKKQSGDGLTTEQTDELERLGVRLADCQRVPICSGEVQKELGITLWSFKNRLCWV